MRWAAVQALGGMPAEVQSQYAGAVAARLEDSEWGVRRAAVRALERMPAIVVEQQVQEGQRHEL